MLKYVQMIPYRVLIVLFCGCLYGLNVGSLSWINAEGSSYKYEEDFSSEVSADGIVYTSVRIPANSLYVNISIWVVAVDHVEDISPFALLRYDGVPTPHHYDAKFEVPKVPSQLGILDLQPTATMLYIAIWGGKLLHSYRFFAGSPSSIPVGVHTTVVSCSSSVLRAPSCLPLPVLPASITNPLTSFTSPMQGHIRYQVNESVSFTWTIPSLVEEARVEVRLSSLQRNADMDGVCKHFLHSLPLILEAYLDQPLEDENYVRIISDLSMESLCSVGGGDASQHLVMSFPLPGTWTVRLRLTTSKYATASSTVENLPFDIHSTLKLVAKPQAPPSRSNESMVILQATRDDASSVGYLHFSSSMLPFSGKYSSSSNEILRMDYIAYLESHRSNLMVGGAMEVQLKIRVPASSVPNEDEFWTRVLLRLGNLPIENSVISVSADTSGNYSLVSLNALQLHSGVDVVSSSNAMKRKGREFIDFSYTWTIMKPLLPQLEDHLSDRMYISVLFPKPVVQEDIQQVRASMGVLLTPCPANACNHGVCYIKRGDVMTSMCLCK